MREQDERGRLELAETRGEKKGKIEGWTETAIKCIKRGKPNEEIADITGLTIAEIQAIRELLG